MDPSQPTNETNINDLYTQAKKAANAGDKRASGLLINEILKLNFSHAGAWALLHTQYGGGRPVEEFQREFAGKYFPAQAHLLEKPTPPLPVTAPSIFADLEDTGPIKVAPPAPTPETWGETPPLNVRPGPVIAPPPVIVPAPVAQPVQVAEVQPVQAPKGEVRFCPRCGQERMAGMPFCARCAFQFSPTSAPPTGTVAPLVHVTPPAQAEPPRAYKRPEPPAPASPASRFTPKRIIAAIGLFAMILSGVFRWSSYYHEYWLGPNISNIDFGISTTEGMIAAIAGLLGMILLFSIHNDGPATWLAAVCAVIAGIAAISFTSQSFGETSDHGMFSMGVGPYVALIGAAIVLVSAFIPSQTTD